MNFPGQWYAVHTHSHTESKAAWHLARQGFTSYLPRYLKRRRHARRVELVPAPLFPRYMFVRFDIATQGWRAISSTLGVARLVCNGERPASVPDSAIARLRESEDAGGLIRLVARPELRPGAAVRIVDGPFVDCLGLYEGMKDGERIAVLLDLLGRKVRVEIKADFVAAA